MYEVAITDSCWFRTYTGPRTTDIIDELPPEDPEAILSDYEVA
jgi:hypothetical protein